MWPEINKHNLQLVHAAFSCDLHMKISCGWKYTCTKTRNCWSQKDKDVPNRFCDVAKRVDRRSPDRLFVRFEQLQQLETNSHPFSRRHELGASIGNSSDQIDAVLLYFLMPTKTMTDVFTRKNTNVFQN